MPALPSALSTNAIGEALVGRVDQPTLKRAIEDLVQPHFFDTPEEKLRAVAVMVKDLAEFSNDVAGWACREWRLRHNVRKPTSTTLRQLCMVRRHELATEQKRRLPKPVERAPFEPATPEQIAERKGMFARIAKANGFVHDRVGQLAFPEDAKPAPRKPHWSETADPDDPRWAALKAAREKAARAATINASPEPF
jgi:hypothetical protein